VKENIPVFATTSATLQGDNVQDGTRTAGDNYLVKSTIRHDIQQYKNPTITTNCKTSNPL